MTIRFKLMLAAIAAILLANTVLSVIGVWYLGRVWLDEVQRRVRLDLNSARSAYNGQISRIQTCLSAVSLDPQLSRALDERDEPTLDQWLARIHRTGGTDLLCLVDESGRVVRRATGQRAGGDDLSSNPLVQQALEQNAAVAGTIVLGHEQLEREDPQLAKRAHFDLLDTRAAVPTEERCRSDGMVVASAVPVAMSRRVIAGDMTARVGIRPPGEFGVLCRAVDEMAEAVANREAELKRVTRRQIGRAQKLASIGRLAAGVAHEINNPLTGVLTFAHLLREKEHLRAEDIEDLDLIIRETSRAADIVRGLLDFSRDRPVHKEPLDVNDAIRRTIQLLRTQKLFHQIEIREEYQNGLPKVDGDVNQLQQVFLNLSLNACGAMPDGGDLAIRTSAGDGRVVIEVTDTGCGIAPDDLDQIFEPFFSTKPAGQGTGLGLSVSYGIVRRHGGTIQVDSEPGKGSKFTIILPALGSEPMAN